MNATRWAFLYTGIQRHEKQQADLFQASLSRVLGAHLIPIRDHETGMLRMPETIAEIQPILPAIARPQFLGAMSEMYEQMEKQHLLVESGDDNGDMLPMELPTDTGMEILDRPLDLSKMSAAERRDVLAAAGVHVVDGKMPSEEEGAVELPRPVKRSSFILDD
jgi:hypothetical protein